MQVNLPDEFRAFLEETVRIGRFASIEDAVIFAVENMIAETDEQLADPDLWASIAQSEREIDEGRGIDCETCMKMLREKYGLAPHEHDSSVASPHSSPTPCPPSKRVR